MSLLMTLCNSICTCCIRSTSAGGRLQSLKLSYASITDKGLATIIVGSSQCHLRDLHLVNCTAITDNGIGQLADSGQMSNLMTLDLTGCVQLSDDTLGHIVKGFDRLVGRAGFVDLVRKRIKIICKAHTDGLYIHIHNNNNKRVSGKITRHQDINDVTARAFITAGMPVTKEPNGLLIAGTR